VVNYTASHHVRVVQSILDCSPGPSNLAPYTSYALGIGSVSNGDIYNDLHGPLTRPVFKVMTFFEVEFLK